MRRYIKAAGLAAVLALLTASFAMAESANKAAAAPSTAAALPPASTSTASTSSSPASTGAALGLQKLRELALQHSAAVRKYQLAVDAASLTKQAQDYAALPSLTASASGAGSYSLASTQSSASALGAQAVGELEATATLFDGGKNAALSKKYDIATQNARESLLAQRLSLLQSTDAAYFAVLEDQASVDAASSALEASKLQLQIAQTKVEAGALSKADYLQSASETASDEATLAADRKNLVAAKAKLASLTGLPASTLLAAVDFSGYSSLIAKLGNLADDSLTALTAKLVSQARATSPSLASYYLLAKEASQDLASSKSAYLPTVSATGIQYLTAPATSTAYPSGSLTIAASMSLDFWTLKNSVDQSQLALSEAQADVDDNASTLDANVEAALDSLVSAATAIPSSEKALEYATSNYENVLEKFKLSSATGSDLSTAQSLVSTDQTALIAARYAFLSDLSSLRTYLGFEDEKELMALIP